MSILKRMKRLISADMHGVLDCLEDPVEICKQAVRDMEEEIQQQQRLQAEIVQKMENTREQIKRSEERLAEVKKRASFCLEHSEDTLLRGLIKKRLQEEKIKTMLEEQSKSMALKKTEIEAQLEEHRDKLASIKQKLECFSHREVLLQNPLGEQPSDLNVTESEIELAFLEAKKAHETACSR